MKHITKFRSLISLVVLFQVHAVLADDLKIDAKLITMTPVLMQRLGLHAGSGVLIVQPGKTFAYFKKNVVIVGIDGDPVTSVEDLLPALQNASDGATVEITDISEAGDENTRTLLIEKKDGLVTLKHIPAKTVAYTSPAIPHHFRKFTHPALEAARAKDYVLVHTFFATDRQDDNWPEAKVTDKIDQDETITFNAERGRLAYGYVDVSIPANHEEGKIESPSWLKMEFKEDPEKHFTIQTRAQMEPNEFWSDIANRTLQSKENAAMVFVHGYRTTFDDAAKRTAQLAFDMHFPGTTAFFSWPSQGTYLGYVKDEQNVAWAQSDFEQFLTDLADKSQAKKFYLIAHSMGARLLTASLKELYAKTPSFRDKIVEVVLAAPDIDADTFKVDIAPGLLGAKNAITIYSSSKDWALLASKGFHGYPRLGDSKQRINVISGINTIDTTDVDNSVIGHSYFGDSVDVLDDIVAMVRGKLDPAERQFLIAKSFDALQYWSLVTH